MGVGKYTPKASLRGDMGWICSEERQWINIYRMWSRLYNMESARINKKAFLWAYGKASLDNVKNWVHQVTTFMNDLGMQHICNVDIQIDCRHVMDDLKIVLQQFYDTKWYEDLNRVNARVGPGRNKLRTYRLFKRIRCIQALDCYGIKRTSNSLLLLTEN